MPPRPADRVLASVGSLPTPLRKLRDRALNATLGAPFFFGVACHSCAINLRATHMGSFMPFRVATWNINSVRLRLPLVERFLREHQPDVLCLQEIKCATDLFPGEALAAAGYKHAVVHGQPGYHGVATISRWPLHEVCRYDFNATGQARHVAVRVSAGAKKRDLIVNNVYVPSGGDVADADVNDKFGDKLAYLAGMAGGMAGEKDQRPWRIAVGDFNVAPDEHDVWSHKQMSGIVSHTPIEIAALARVREAGAWTDVMRALRPSPQKLYTWWSYRAKDWRTTNRGRRLDHVWASADLAPLAKTMQIIDATRDWTQTSDHVPVLVDFKL